MKKLATKRRIFLVLGLILIAFITKTYLFEKEKSKKETNQDQQTLSQEAEYSKKLLDSRSIKVKKITESISNEVEIIVLKETGNVQMFHDKTPENSKYIEWAIDSNISLDIYYTAIFTINTENIEVSYNEKEDRINIIYDLEKLEVKSVNIDNILSETSKGIFGKQYSANETSAFTLFAIDNVKEELLNDNALKYLASINLEGYLRNLSYKLRVFNVSVFQK